MTNRVNFFLRHPVRAANKSNITILPEALQLDNLLNNKGYWAKLSNLFFKHQWWYLHQTKFEHFCDINIQHHKVDFICFLFSLKIRHKNEGLKNK